MEIPWAYVTVNVVSAGLGELRGHCGDRLDSLLVGQQVRDFAPPKDG
jgi:hypothetical protein